MGAPQAAGFGCGHQSSSLRKIHSRVFKSRSCRRCREGHLRRVYPTVPRNFTHQVSPASFSFGVSNCAAFCVCACCALSGHISADGIVAGCCWQWGGRYGLSGERHFLEIKGNLASISPHLSALQIMLIMRQLPLQPLSNVIFFLCPVGQISQWWAAPPSSSSFPSSPCGDQVSLHWEKQGGSTIRAARSGVSRQTPFTNLSI